MAGFPQLSIDTQQQKKVARFATTVSSLGYTSVRYVKISDTRLALIYYGILLALLAYVIVDKIIVLKGYQESDSLEGTYNIKVKGTARAQGTGIEYDVYDLIHPATENDALFITTTFGSTVQTRGVCPGNSKDSVFSSPTRENCTANADCPANFFTYNGIMNGTCDTSAGFCFLTAWCPVENDAVMAQMQKDNVMENVADFSILAKANIVFPNFGLHSDNGDTLTPGINQFFPRDMLATAGSSFDAVNQTGAVLLVSMHFNCDADDSSDRCEPEVDVTRIDTQSQLKAFKPGFNYRFIACAECALSTSLGYTTYSTDSTTGEEKRILTKLWGLRILFQLSGTAGRFSLTALTTSFGAGIALLSISKLICDLLLQYVLPNKEKYEKQKFTLVNVNSEPNLLSPEAVSSSFSRP